MKRRKQILYSVLLILVIAVIGAILLFFQPRAKQERPQEIAASVITVSVEPKTHQLTLSASGTVEADREVSIKPEVSGLVRWLSPNFDKGGRLAKGELLIKIDPRDYINAVEQSKAALEKTRLAYQVELGRQVIAEKEWSLLSEAVKTSALSEELALRKPHLIEAKAALDAAKSALKKAELDLSRTVIKAPFDALVISESAEEGQLVGRETEIAKLVGTNQFRVQVSLPVDQLQYISLGDTAKINGKWEGVVQRYLGDLDSAGRMARLLILIPDPLQSTPPLLLGTYVQVAILGEKFEEVYKLPLEAIRTNDTVWIATKDNTLEIRDVEVIIREADGALIRSGLEPGDRVVISPLALPVPGMLLYE